MEGHTNIFDADAYSEGLEVPSIKIDDVDYVGRVLSYEEFLPFEARMRLAVHGKLTGMSFNRLILDYCDEVFPTPGWRFWKPSVGRLVLGLPPLTMIEALKSFLEFQVRAMGMELEVEAPAEAVTEEEHQQET